MFDHVFALYRPCAYPGADLWHAMVLRWSNRRARDHRNHVAPRRKPNPASQRSQLTKLYFEHASFSKNRTVFSQTFMRRSVGISRICRVKKFQNPSFKIQQSTRIDRIARNPHMLSVKKISRSGARSRRTTRKKKPGADGDWESTSVPSRQAGDRESRSSFPSLWRVTEEKNTDVYFTETVPFSWVVEGTPFAWGLKKKSTQRSYFPLWKDIKKRHTGTN